MSLLLTGATALFVKIFVHGNKEQNWLSAVPMKSHVFEEREESLSRCCLFASGFLLWPHHHPTISIFYHLPDSCLCSWASHTDFVSSFFCFFSSADFSWSSFLYSRPPFYSFARDFIQWCPLMSAKLFPLSLLNFVLTFASPTRWLYIILRCFKSNRCSCNQHLSPYMNMGDCQFLYFSVT